MAIELSRYTFESLRSDKEFHLCRGRGAVEPPSILVLAPALQQSELKTIKRLEHEYCFRDELDPEWAARPIGLTRHWDRAVLVLEDPGGELLDRFLGQPMEIARFLRLAVSLGAGLNKLHRRGLIHKDIKPANILVDSVANKVWFTGFGISSRLVRERQAAEPPDVIAGTLAYMAPEQTGRMNRSIDSRSDLYSLGVTFYQMLTGFLPFTASDPMEWVHCHIARQPASPGERVENIPASVSAIIMKLMAKTAEERYQTAAGLEADLKGCLAQWDTQRHIDGFTLGQHDTPDRLLIPEKLYGRAREIDTLLASFDRVVASGAPELVLVSGNSGIGKSSVVNELHKVLLPPRGLFASGKFDQYKRDIPYSPLAQAFQRLIRPILAKSESELDKWRDALRETLGPNGQLIVDLVPELKLIIGEQPAVPELPPQDAQRRFQLVSRRFIGVFARPEHPLVLFLDDLQWLDAATLELFKQFFTRPDIQYLLLIGAYRDNEVTPSHPLMLTLKAIRETEATVHEIVLKPLSFYDVNRLLVEALHCEPARTRPLASLLHKKTGGNPFFTLQFLSTLAEEHLLHFETDEAAWRWDLNRMPAAAFTDNVADLMIVKLRRLPDAAQEALKQFACLGDGADVDTLLAIRGGSETRLHQDLWDAVRAGLIQKLGNSYRFLHDRIREAAYLLIPEQMRAEFHLNLGRLLIAKMNSEQITEKIFDIVNQLNASLALISEPDEKLRLAELNLKAARKAKAATAYASACIYLSAGRKVVGQTGWEHCYQLAFSLWLELAECEYLNGNFDKAEELITELLCKAGSKVDKAMAYRLQILVHMMRAEYRHAINAGLECLRVFGIDISAHPARNQVQDEYEKVWISLSDRSIESLVELPPMIDPEKQAAMQLLSVLTAPAFFTDSNLFNLVVYKIANTSLKYGTTDASVQGYADLGLILGPVFHRYGEGYRFAKLACSVAEKYGFHFYKARAYYNTEQVGLWTQPVRKAIHFIRLAFDACIETHDLTYACYCCNHLVTDLLLQGVHLEEVWREAQKGLEFVRKVKYRDVADVIVSQQRFILNLCGRTAAFSTFSDAEFDEESFEGQLTDDRMPNMVCWYWILKLQARFLSGDYEAANRAAEKARALLWSTERFVELTNYYFYHALTIAALLHGSDQQIEILKGYLQRLREWAENCPETFENRAALVEAELARVEGRELDAERLYEQAIRSARASGFVHHEALAYELAACFYAARGFEDFAHVYLRKARYCYLRWGADGKVRQLDEIYPQLRTEEPAPSPTGTIEAPPERLDLATISRMSQAVSSEIVLEKLIETLLRIALEQAGADRGLLILPQNVLTSSRPAKGEHHQIEAEIKSGADQVEVQLRKAPVTPAELPDSLLRYVLRTQQHVILDDASVQNLFSEDEYIRQKHPRSVLCLPLVKQTKLMGVLYLENNLAPGVFTPKRLTMLELLVSQAAISLDHARMYAELSRENSDRRKAEEALRASEQRLQDIIDNTPAVVTVKDLDLHYLLINREHERRFQVQRDQIRGKTDYDFLPRDVAEKIRANDRQLIEAGSPIQFEVTTPMTESERHYVIVKFLLRDGTGKPYAVCGISTDITERKRAEEARQKAQAELAHVTRVATLGELAGSIAHEVKQPLTAIINNAHACLALLPGEISKLEDVREALSDIISDADRASAVIERIRGLIKKSPPQKSRLDLNETIGGVIALARGELDRNKVLLRTKLANDLPVIMGDRTQLQQVILNLIINAIEAMSGVSDGPRELSISSEKVIGMLGEGEQGRLADPAGLEAERRTPNADLSAVALAKSERRTQNECVLVSVADSGPGLDPNILGRLFDAFYTTKPEGLGMGLSISRSLIEAHGGRLWARANVPKGALFQFTLPIGAQ